MSKPGLSGLAESMTGGLIASRITSQQVPAMSLKVG